MVAGEPRPDDLAGVCRATQELQCDDPSPPRGSHWPQRRFCAETSPSVCASITQPERPGEVGTQVVGFRSVDCYLQYSGRNQLHRNLEAARDLAAGREFGVFVISEEEIPETALGSSEAGLPHLNTAERAELMSHYLGTLTWSQVCEVTGMDYRSLPRNVARRVKRPGGFMSEPLCSFRARSSNGPVHGTKALDLIIEMALLNSTHVVAVMTANTRGSEWVPYEYGRVKTPQLPISLQAACWADPRIGLDLPGYLYLGEIHRSESDVRQWFQTELQKQPRKRIGPCGWTGPAPEPI